MSDEAPQVPEDYALIPLPKKPGVEEAWAEVERRAHSVRVKLGLRLLLHGYTYREAARHCGLDWGNLSDAARRYDMMTLIAGEDRIINRHREIAAKATDELSRRLDTPEKLSASELNFIGGTSTDKVLAWKKVESGDANREGELERIARAVTDRGGSLHLTIEAGDGRRAEIETGE